MKPFLEFLAKFFGYKTPRTNALSDGESNQQPHEFAVVLRGHEKDEEPHLDGGNLAKVSDEIRAKSREETLFEIAQVELMPALTVVSENLLQALARPGTYLDDVVDLISRDPLLSLSLLGAANSLASEERVRPGEIDTAVQMLGVRRLASLVERHLEIQKATNSISVLDLHPLWIHSLAVGLIAEELSRRLVYGHPRQMYFAGLWHDAGKMVLCQIFPDSYGKVLALASSGEGGLEELELQYFGVTHSEVGMFYANRCGAGPLAVQAIMHHAVPENAQLNGGGAAIVGIANHLAEAAGIGFRGSSQTVLDDSGVHLAGLSAWTVLMAETGRKEDVLELHQAVQPFLKSLASDLDFVRRSL
jgi:HD-like signal output (HDOD) protein